MKVLKPSLLALLAVCLAAPLSALHESSFDKALNTFTRDVRKKLPPELRNVAVYGVLKDPKKRYDDTRVKKLVGQQLRLASRALIERGEALVDVQQEQALTASGLIDIATVKQAGQLAGVDAYFFVYPAISGAFGQRLTLLIKAVSVRTGAVVFVQEYRFEERLLASIQATVQASLYRGYGWQSTVLAGNATRSNECHVVMGDPGDPTIEVKALFNIPRANISLSAGVALTSGATGDTLGLTNMYLADVRNPTITVQGFHLRGFAPVFDLVLPVSYVFGDVHDRLRLKAGCVLNILTAGGETGKGGRDGNLLNADTSRNTAFPKLDTHRFEFKEPAAFAAPLWRVGLELEALTGILFVLNLNFTTAWEAPTEQLIGANPKHTLQVIHQGQAGFGVSFGISYRVF